MKITKGDLITILIIILAAWLLFGCNGNNGNCDRPQRYYGDTYNYSEYINKTVSNIRYGKYEAPSGDYLTLSFTDNTYLKIYAYKYDMKIGDADGYDANGYNYDSFKGLTIKYIRYGKYEGHSGDVLHIVFQNFHQLDIYAYKYTMEICK